MDPAKFGTGMATVTSYTSTPEPTPLILVASGLLLIGFAATHRVS